MKCNLKDLNRMTPKSREILLKSLYETNKQILDEKVDRIIVILTNNLFKIFVVACNEELSIGQSRMLKILENVSEKVQSMKEDNDDFFILTEEKCKKILGIELYKKFFSDIPFNPLPKDFNFIGNLKK